MNSDSTIEVSPVGSQQAGDDVIAALNTNRKQGLSDSEAKIRLDRYGRNELKSEARVPAWRKFLAQFSDALVILLLIATTISATLWLYERESALPYEAIAILSVVLLADARLNRWATSATSEMWIPIWS